MILRILALVALSLVSSAALARPPMETNQLVDDVGTPVGTVANPLTISATRQVSFVEANSAAIAVNGLSTQTSRTPGSAYTKFNATAGCTASGASLIVDGSNDGFASYVTVAIIAIAANSRNSGAAGSTISAPVNFASYRGYVTNGANANTCSVVSSFTVN